LHYSLTLFDPADRLSDGKDEAIHPLVSEQGRFGMSLV
jgi:hypothetical protein